MAAYGFGLRSLMDRYTQGQERSKLIALFFQFSDHLRFGPAVAKAHRVTSVCRQTQQRLALFPIVKPFVESNHCFEFVSFVFPPAGRR